MAKRHFYGAVKILSGVSGECNRGIHSALFSSLLPCSPLPLIAGNVCKSLRAAPIARCCYRCGISMMGTSLRNTTSSERLSPICYPMTSKASGLHLNLSELHEWWPKELTESAKAAYPTGFSQEYTEGTSILNAPLGTHEYMEDNIVTKVKALEPLFEWLPLWKMRLEQGLTCYLFRFRHLLVGTRTLIRRYALSQEPLRQGVCLHFPARGASCSGATRLYL